MQISNLSKIFYNLEKVTANGSRIGTYLAGGKTAKFIELGRESLLYKRGLREISLMDEFTSVITANGSSKNFSKSDFIKYIHGKTGIRITKNANTKTISFVIPENHHGIIEINRGENNTFIDFLDKDGYCDNIIFANSDKNKIREFFRNLRRDFDSTTRQNTPAIDTLKGTQNADISIKSTEVKIPKYGKWKSIERKDITVENNWDSWRGRYIYPENTKSVSEITATDPNGGKMKIQIYRDSNGKSIGSSTEFPDGRKTFISIQEEPRFAEHNGVGEGKPYELVQEGFTPKAKIIRRTTEHPNIHRDDESITFSEIFERQNDKHKYQSVIRVRRTPQEGFTDGYTQEVMEIETGNSKPDIKRIRLNSTRNSDNTMTLNSVERLGKEVENIDSSHPYFQTMLLDPEIMLKAKYAEDIKRMGYDGIAPDLIADRYNWHYFQSRAWEPDSNGVCFSDGSVIAVNLSHYDCGRRTKAQLAGTLRHEEEHLFNQHANVQRAGIKDFRSDCEASRRFYDGVVERFGHIRPGTKEYEEARLFGYELENYDNITNINDRFNPQGYYTLTVENNAFNRGREEEGVFNSCIAQFKNVFKLLNKMFINYGKPI